MLTASLPCKSKEMITDQLITSNKMMLKGQGFIKNNLHKEFDHQMVISWNIG